MKERHSDLIKDVKTQQRQTYVNNLLSLDHWYITVLGTMLYYMIITSVTMFTGITLDADGYGPFIDQRSSNLATISGMCLAVITFLMSNIAVKEPYAYKLLFTSTKMYAAIFFVLTSLGCFIMVSTLRNTIPKACYPYFVLSSSFVFVTVLFVIGYLFSRAIYYTNPKKIDEFMNRELQLGASVIIFHGLMRKYSLERYQQLMKQHGALPYSLSDHFNSSWLFNTTSWQSQEEVIAQEQQQKYVLDIDVVLLANYIQQKEKPVYYHNLAFNESTELSDNYIFRPGQDNSPEEKRALKNILFLTKQKEHYSSVIEIREHFDEKMILYSEKGQTKELARILDGIKVLMKLQVVHGLSVPFNLTENFLKVLRTALALSVKENKYTSFESLVIFFYGHSHYAIKEKNKSLFTDLLSLNIFVYLSVIERKGALAYRDILGLGLDASGFYQEYFYLILKMEEQKNEKATQASVYAKIIYESFALLMFYMILYKDLLGLKKAVKLLHGQFGVFSDFDAKTEMEQLKLASQDVNSYKAIRKLKIKYQQSKHPQVLRRHALFGIKSWTLHLLRNTKITPTEAVEMTKGMVMQYVDKDDALEDIFFIRKGATAIGYFSWQSWTFESDSEDEQAGISDPIGWLTFGFMAEQIIQFSLPYITDDLDVEDFIYIGMLKEQLISFKKEFEGDFDKWKEVLKVSDLADLERKSQSIIDYFDRLEQKKDGEELKRIAEEPLDADLVEEQTESAQKTWMEHAHIFKLFKQTGMAKVSQEELDFVGEQGYAKKYKEFFIKNGQKLTVLPTASGQVARDMDNQFFRMAFHDARYTTTEKTLSEVIIKGIEMLKQNNVSPDYILIEPYNRYNDEELIKHEDFEKNQGARERQSPLLFGWFRSVPIYMFHNSELINKVIIAEGSRAFELEYQEFPDRFEKFLEVSLKTLTNDEAEALYQKQPLANPSTQEKQERIWSIKNGVSLKIGANYRFRILDDSAYLLGTIK